MSVWLAPRGILEDCLLCNRNYIAKRNDHVYMFVFPDIYTRSGSLLPSRSSMDRNNWICKK